MKLYLFESEKAIKTFLSRTAIRPVSSFYLALSQPSQQIRNVLNHQNIKALPMRDPQATQRDALVKQYVTLIGEINRRQQCRLWWATDLSSKNRFMNRLPDYIKDLLEIEALLKRSPEGDVYIFPVAPILEQTLIGLFNKVRIPYQFIQQPFFAWGLRGKRICRSIVGWSYHFVRSIIRWGWCRWTLAEKIERQLQGLSQCYVIKCFTYPHSFAKETAEYKDIFYNQLPDFLQQKGEKVVFFANLLGNLKANLHGILKCPNAILVPLEYGMTFFDIVKAYVEMAVYRPRVLSDLSFQGIEISDLMNQEIKWGAGKIQPYQYLHYIQTQRLIERLKPKIFLMTYENNPWEKMCTLAIRDHAVMTKIFAYQHTVNPQASVNMFHSQAEEAFAPMPDRVLAIGEVSKQVIERYTQSRKPLIEPTGALQFEHLWKLPIYPRTKTGTILLGLEGIFDVYKMINYVLAELKDTQKYRVIIRAHPVLPVKAFAHMIPGELLNLPFVEISQGFSLQQDIARSDVMIYWGSMAALEAQWMGKPLIHFDMQSLFSYDALFASSHFKWVVREDTPLIPVVEAIAQLPDEIFFKEQQQAKAYLKTYFSNITEEKLKQFLG